MKNAKATVGCIIEKDGRILLTLRGIGPFKYHWCLPGGHIERYEKAIDAVRREVKEETGLEIEPEFFDCYDEIYEDIKWHAVALIFVSQGFGETKKQEEEVKSIHWFGKEDIFKLPLAFEHKKVLEDYFKKKK